MEEERRLCYVGITRAQKRLFLSRASQRMLYNQVNHNAPSRFLWRKSRSACWRTRWRGQAQADLQGYVRASAADALYAARTTAAGTNRTGAVGSAPIRPRQRQCRRWAVICWNIPGVQKGFVQPSKARQYAPLQRHAEPVSPRRSRAATCKFGEGSGGGGYGFGQRDARIKIEFTAYGTKEFALATAPIVKLED